MSTLNSNTYKNLNFRPLFIITDSNNIETNRFHVWISAHNVPHFDVLLPVQFYLQKMFGIYMNPAQIDF